MPQHENAYRAERSQHQAVVEDEWNAKKGKKGQSFSHHKKR